MRRNRFLSLALLGITSTFISAYIPSTSFPKLFTSYNPRNFANSTVLAAELPSSSTGDYCSSGQVISQGINAGSDGKTYTSAFDFTHGIEKVNAQACGREYLIPSDPSQSNFGTKFVYLVDGFKNRISQTLYVEQSDGSLKTYQNPQASNINNSRIINSQTTRANRAIASLNDGLGISNSTSRKVTNSNRVNAGSQTTATSSSTINPNTAISVMSTASLMTTSTTNLTSNNIVYLNSSTLTSLSGCTGLSPSRLEMYCNNDGGYLTDNRFNVTPGIYRLDITGQSSNSNYAGVDIYLDNTKVGTVGWNSTTQSAQSISFNVSSGSSHQLKFTISTDNGSSDTYLYSYMLSYVGAPPAPKASPTPASVGAALSGTYRNLFAEWGQSSTAIDSKVNAAYSSLFDPTSPNTIYYEVGTDMAYIKDIGNNDIRTEGMSYGMMIAVQMNDRVKFNKLWKFAKTYMQCPNKNFSCGTAGQRDGYFAWALNASAPFTPKDVNPAPDGEEYYATSLLFAAGRWGNGSGIFNYQAEAQTILNAMLNDSRPNSFHSMFNLANRLVVFSPNNQSALDTDPSYHLPAFYEVWARYDSNTSNRTFWAAAAVASRNYWSSVIGSRTNGLFPDCTNFTGTATNNCAGGAKYSYDAWRAISNVAVDWAWWAGDASGAPITKQKTWADQLQAFLGAKRPSYANQWNLDGTSVGGDTNSTGQIAMNGVAGLAGSTTRVWDFVSDVWNLSIPSGQWRYYDGSLYMMALLHMSGKFRVYPPSGTVTSGGTTTTPTPIPTPTPAPTTDPTPTSPSGGTTTPSSSGFNQIQGETYNSQFDTANLGSSVKLNSNASWIGYNSIDFGSATANSVQVYARTSLPGVNINFRTGSSTGQIICTVYPNSDGSWHTGSNTCWPKPTGNQAIYITVTGGSVEIDWIQFNQ